jgi:putative exosortase-associated protein (TIGR04073 family)
MRRIVPIIFAVLFVLSSNAYAGGAFDKLGRGVSNTATGWIEAFNSVGEEWNENHNVADSLGKIPEGLLKAGLRTVAGIYEIVTFPLPVPRDYKSVITPEFINLPSPVDERVTNDKKEWDPFWDDKL